MIINVPWCDLKAFAIARSTSIQWIIANGSYYLSAVDGPTEVTSKIIMDGSDTSDQTDFETNYKTNGNQSIKTNVVQHLGLDNITIAPFGVLFDAPANVTTTYDYKLTDTYSLKGGILFAPTGNIGDSISIEIVDVDNITGYGANTVLASYVTNWYVISAPLSAGLYFRFIYVNTSASTDTKVIVNMIAYKGNA